MTMNTAKTLIEESSKQLVSNTAVNPSYFSIPINSIKNVIDTVQTLPPFSPLAKLVTSKSVDAIRFKAQSSTPPLDGFPSQISIVIKMAKQTVLPIEMQTVANIKTIQVIFIIDMDDNATRQETVMMDLSDEKRNAFLSNTENVALLCHFLNITGKIIKAGKNTFNISIPVFDNNRAAWFVKDRFLHHYRYFFVYDIVQRWLKSPKSSFVNVKQLFETKSGDGKRAGHSTSGSKAATGAAHPKLYVGTIAPATYTYITTKLSKKIISKAKYISQDQLYHVELDLQKLATKIDTVDTKNTPELTYLLGLAGDGDLALSSPKIQYGGCACMDHLF